MTRDFKEYVTANGEVILYVGKPDLQKLEDLASGPGDIWHSSFEQGFKNAFPELAYQVMVFFWYIRDFDNLDVCVSWRVNPFAFAVRKSVWEFYGGFRDYENPMVQALDFGFNTLSHGALPLYVKGLFVDAAPQKIAISVKDRHIFFRKNFKPEQAIYMIYRKGMWKPAEWSAFFYAKKHAKRLPKPPYLPARKLMEMQGNPSVSYIIPTMSRQDYTLQLLGDLQAQTYIPAQVVVVDATPEDQRDESLYDPKKYPFTLDVIWQKSKGSCRARNEAIDICTGDFIIFGDDDIRLKSDFVENHIRFLQTYGVGAANGLDIRADHHRDGLDVLEEKLEKRGTKRFLAGAAHLMSNSNACVKREYVDKIIGNDINYDGGYGEDNDFGLTLVKEGF
ncbi:MAG: glycosyltransferase, partial [Flavobacterium sp.]